MQLLDTDIQTREVLSWKGVHVFHAHLSSCSQKLRVFLNCKNIAWHSHPVDLNKVENLGPYYMGINPRGLVPTLVHDETGAWCSTHPSLGPSAVHGHRHPP